MGLTNIQWCCYSFNPWLGCRKVADECKNCYIITTPAFKFRGLKHGAERIRTAESTWKNPLAWNRKAAREGVRERVFGNSLCDWLDDENVPIEWLSDYMRLIFSTPELDWLLLTKRPQNWQQRIEGAFHSLFDRGFQEDAGRLESWLACAGTGPLAGVPPRNIWIGVSAGADQKAALSIPARIHFLSCEPMLRPLDTTHADRFDWIIFGGESDGKSGKNARRCDVDWILNGVTFCNERGIACFVKQLGAKPFQNVDSPMEDLHTLKDSHGGDISEWPEDLRVREFPTVEGNR